MTQYIACDVLFWKDQVLPSIHMIESLVLLFPFHFKLDGI